jgi:MFS family permease
MVGSRPPLGTIVTPSAAPPAPSAASIRNLRIFQCGQALSNVGTFSQVVALALLILELSDSGFILGLTMALQAVPMLVLSPWVGPLLDQLPLRRLLLVTAVLGALQASILAVLASTGLMSVPWVLALAFSLGCIQSFERPGAQAFLVELVPRETIARAVGLASSTQAFGRLGGPALAAVLYAWHGAGLVFAVNAASYFVMIAALLLLRTAALLPRGSRSAGRVQLWPAVGVAWRSPVLGPVLLSNTIVGLFAFNFGTFFPSMATLVFHQPTLFGMGATINASAAVLAGLVLARYLRRPTLLTVAVACLALGSALAGVALSPSPAFYLACMPFFGFFVVCYTTSTQALVQQHAPRAMAGRMMGLYTLGTMGTTPLGGLLVGWVADVASPRASVGLVAGSAMAIGLVMLARWHGERRARRRGGSFAVDPPA